MAMAATAEESWIEVAEARLRESGHRASEPRAAVLRLLARQDCVRSAHQIASALRSRKRPVGIATVYRTLELLEELKLVQRLDVGGGSARFEPALPGGEHHHHHFVCENCGKVAPFSDERLERAIDAVGDRLAFDVGGHDVILKGRCGCA